MKWSHLIDGKRTKIIATVGPASNDEKTLQAMILKGTDMFRLNASHSKDPSGMVEAVKNIQALSKKLQKPVGIFMDLQGPKIRVGLFENDEVTLETGATFSITTEEVLGTAKRACVRYQGFVDDVQVGEPVFIDDGRIKLKVTDKTDTDLICEVISGGLLSNKKGVNLPLSQLKISPFTEKDKQDLQVVKMAQLDYVALSFVSNAEDITRFRAHLKSLGAEKTLIIAKIERQLAIDNLIPIIDAADAIMVARGDLGVEVGFEKVPKLQKIIISESNKRQKPVIVATQMLETMITSETPTRAEVSDVANAVYDHCDAVMLSGETATGINPPNVIDFMSNICEEADSHMIQLKIDGERTRTQFLENSRPSSICKAAEHIAQENNAKAIMAFTSSGNTPLIASKVDSNFHILAPTDDPLICQRMALYHGVIPMMMPKPFKEIEKWSDMIDLAVEEAVKLGLLKKGDNVVVTAGIPIGKSNGINSIRIITV